MFQFECELTDLITDDDLQSLECPTIEEQTRIWQTITSFINTEGLERLLKSITDRQLSLVSFRTFDESGGIVNQIYLVQVYDALAKADQELILKIINAEARFHNHKACEGALIKYLQANTTIPVPNVLSYSNDPVSSPIKCKYVLLERAPGCPLKDLLPQYPDGVPESLLRELVDFVRQLRLLRPFDRELVGCFGVCSSEPELWPPHPKKRLHSTYFEAWNESIAFCINEMKKLKTHLAVANTLNEKRLQLLDRIAQIKAHAQLAPTLNDLVHDKRFYLTHGDLNETNIIVDPETLKINCIIDWEWSEYSISDDLNLHHYWYDSEPAMRQQFREVVRRILGESEFSKSKSMRKFKQYLFRLFISATCSCNINCFFLKHQKTSSEKSLEVRRTLLRHLEELENRLKSFDLYMDQAFDLSP